MDGWILINEFIMTFNHCSRVKKYSKCLVHLFFYLQILIIGISGQHSEKLKQNKKTHFCKKMTELISSLHTYKGHPYHSGQAYASYLWIALFVIMQRGRVPERIKFTYICHMQLQKYTATFCIAN